MISPEEKAGRLYVDAWEACENGGHAMRMLASHIPAMLKDDAWKYRVVPPDGKEVRLESFADYIKKQPREGLDLDYLTLRNLLKSMGKRGHKALMLLRREIPEFDSEADDDERRSSVEVAEAQVEKGGELYVKQGSRTDTTSLSNNEVNGHRQGTSAEYLLRRLARDHADIFAEYQAGEHKSVRAAAMEAGIIKPTATFRTDDATKAIASLLKHYSKDELLAALTDVTRHV